MQLLNLISIIQNIKQVILTILKQAKNTWVCITHIDNNYFRDLLS